MTTVDSSISRPGVGHALPRGSLRLESLGVRFRLGGRRRAIVSAVTDVSLTMLPGRVLAVVGESGCGKSALASAVLGLLPPNGEVRGRAFLHDTDAALDLAHCPEPILASHIRGRRIALIPQSAATHLTPVRTAASQVAETVRTLEPGCRNVPKRLHELADEVGLDHDDLDRYPHELSGGMAQRVALAMVLAGDPDVVVADEPTTGLDRALAERAIAILRTLADQGRTVLLVTHDIAAANRVADDVAVMYASRLLEVGPAAQVLNEPWHDYTNALLSALPEHGLIPLPGPPPELTDLGSGCPFHQRVAGDCDGRPMLSLDGDRWVACGRGEQPMSVQDVTSC